MVVFNLIIASVGILNSCMTLRLLSLIKENQGSPPWDNPHNRENKKGLDVNSKEYEDELYKWIKKLSHPQHKEAMSQSIISKEETNSIQEQAKKPRKKQKHNGKNKLHSMRRRKSLLKCHHKKSKTSKKIINSRNK